MSQHVLLEIEMRTDLDKFHLPAGVQDRLQELLDRQDRGELLTAAEQAEAAGLVSHRAAGRCESSHHRKTCVSNKSRLTHALHERPQPLRLEADRQSWPQYGSCP